MKMVMPAELHGWMRFNNGYDGTVPSIDCGVDHCIAPVFAAKFIVVMTFV